MGNQSINSQRQAPTEFAPGRFAPIRLAARCRNRNRSRLKIWKRKRKPLREVQKGEGRNTVKRAKDDGRHSLLSKIVLCQRENLYPTEHKKHYRTLGIGRYPLDFAPDFMVVCPTGRTQFIQHRRRMVVRYPPLVGRHPRFRRSIQKSARGTHPSCEIFDTAPQEAHPKNSRTMIEAICSGTI